jgi:type I restriction-modification system DNA methylase subunit
MNLAIRGIDSSQIKWNSEGSFLNDALKDVRADYILANPPFNDSDWSGDQLRSDARWQYGVPTLLGSSISLFTWPPAVRPELCWQKARSPAKAAAKVKSGDA